MRAGNIDFVRKGSNSIYLPFVTAWIQLAAGATLALAAAFGPARLGGQSPPQADTTAAGSDSPPAAGAARGFVYRIVVDGVISPASAEYIERAVEKAADDGAEALVIELDTPGGLVESTREIVQEMLASHVPVVVYVAPGGARAGSAGVFLTLAAHVAAMAPGTNIGAATPIRMGGEGLPAPPDRPSPADTLPGGEDAADGQEDDEAEGPGGLDRKVLEDTVAFIRAIAERRGRNADWAERAVREAVSITETQALEENVVDLVAPSLPALLEAIDGLEVQVASGTATLDTRTAEVRTIEKGLRFRVLEAIANPNIAFVLMLIGIYGIFFELMNPGAILPGVVGVISLLLAFFALSTLPVNYVGVLLILFSLVLFIAEIKVTSYGLLSVGGLVAFILGATMLFDAPGSLLRVSWSVIIPAALLTAGFFVVSLGLAYRTWRTPPTTGREGIVGRRGVVRRRIDPEGQVLVHGELWAAAADEPLEAGTEVEVVAAKGLVLTVRRV